jgi:hypothetical protein
MNMPIVVPASGTLSSRPDTVVPKRTSSESTEHQGPGRRCQPAERDALGAAELVDAFRQDRIDRLPDMVLGAVARRRRRIERDRRRRVDAPKTALPPIEGRDLVTLLQEPDVIGERSCSSRVDHGAVGQLRVDREHLVEQQLRRPPVQQRVMAIPDQLMAVIRAHEQHVHEHVAGQIEPGVALTLEERVESHSALDVGSAAPVVLLPRQNDDTLHYLHRLVEALPQESRPRRRMAPTDDVPRLSEPLGVHVPGQCTRSLTEIRSYRRAQRVVEHAELRRGQRIDVLDVLEPARCRHQRPDPREIGVADREASVAGRLIAGRLVAGRLIVDRRPRAVGDRCQLGDGLVREDVPRRDRPPQLPNGRNDLDAGDRVPAEIEEVVVDADGRHLECVTPDLDESSLGFAARRAIPGVGLAHTARIGQHVTVDLAIDRER